MKSLSRRTVRAKSWGMTQASRRLRAVGRNGADFHGQKRSSETHASTTDPQALP